MDAVLSDIVDLLRPQLTANKVDVSLALGRQPIYVSVDESSIRGALMNLMLNAIEAMPKGGTLTIAAEQNHETVRLEITDTGTGIGEEEAKKILEPFYTTKAQGLGLGMPYAKKIIDQHGGTITLNSRIGEGTTISITLPAGKQEVNDAS